MKTENRFSRPLQLDRRLASWSWCKVLNIWIKYILEPTLGPGQQPPSQHQQDKGVDYRKWQGEEHVPLSINGTTVERVSSFRFLGVDSISRGLTWTHHTETLTKTAIQRLLFLCRLRSFNMDSRILCHFYRCTIKRILTGCVTAWYGRCTGLNRKALQRVVKTAQHITRKELPSMEDLYTKWCKKKANEIIKPPQPQTGLPAAIRHMVPQHLVLHHRAQLHPSGHKTAELLSSRAHYCHFTRHLLTLMSLYVILLLLTGYYLFHLCLYIFIFTVYTCIHHSRCTYIHYYLFIWSLLCTCVPQYYI